MGVECAPETSTPSDPELEAPTVPLTPPKHAGTLPKILRVLNPKPLNPKALRL